MGIETRASRPAAADRPAAISSRAAPRVPQWVGDFAPSRFRHVTAGFDGARGMDILTFREHVVEAYRAIFEQLDATIFTHPVRFWAFVPGIHDALGAGLDRYMAFNAGRYGAFATHFGRATSLARSIPTASAVGVDGDRFLLHCVAADEPGLPVENPRQISAYLYSRRYGPMPPCFARATLLRGHADQPVLLVGGTASITGEESRHIGDLEAQARETFHNLASVVAVAAGRTTPDDMARPEIASLLASFRELRVYYANPTDQHTLAGMVEATFPSHCRVEWQWASLCRPELLIEIEGLAFPAAAPMGAERPHGIRSTPMRGAYE
jgi:chorismate lyase / 3-hydroxybenzoate synthase